MMTIRVAVIGAGAAGLCALRHLSVQQPQFQAVCFEQNTRPGGTWIYTEKTGTDSYGLPIHSSMYKNLKTNLPKEVMAFPDFPFRQDLPSFVRHEDMLEYLEDYAAHFDLLKYIKFSTSVSRVHPLKSEDKVTWEVTYKALSEPVAKPVTEHFDAVMVCNGHYSVPLIPEISGLEKFKGEIKHSHNYHHPTEFEGHTVVCLGAGASGQDISVDVSSAAKKVYMSHRKQFLQSYLPENVEQKPGIERVTEHTIVFQDGDEVTVDTILFCTGYHYSFPFLTPECKVEIEEEHIVPLYKHILHPEYPSLSLVGILKTICPFPNFHNQILFAIAALDGSMKLPSQEEMKKDIAADFDKRLLDGMPTRYAHHMGSRQWRYNDEIADLAGFEHIPTVVENLYDYVHLTRVKDIVHYKSVNYKLRGHESYEVLSGDKISET